MKKFNYWIGLMRSNSHRNVSARVLPFGKAAIRIYSIHFFRSLALVQSRQYYNGYNTKLDALTLSIK